MESIEDVPVGERWRYKVLEICENASQLIEAAWVTGIQSAEKWLPGNGEELTQQRLLMLELFFDYLFGTALAIATHYGSTDEDFEQYVSNKLREKFERLRERKNAT